MYDKATTKQGGEDDMENNIFQRWELKYLVDSRQRSMLEQSIERHMRPDPHGESCICNVYYDTPDYRLIRQSLDKPIYKEKLRLRSYGRVRPHNEVFLELKKKYQGVVYKRRISLSDWEAELYMAGRLPLLEDTQIGREIDYFKRFYGNLQPAVYLCYDRCAYFSTEDPDLRATFDRRIRWRQEDMSLTARPGGQHLLQPYQSLFEIKTASSVPLWLVEVLEAGEIRQASFSKYGEAYKMIISERSGVSCA